MLARLFLLFLVLVPALPARADTTPLRLAICDLEGIEQLQREFGAFREILVAKSGLSIEFFPVPNRTAAVEAMRSKRIDFALTGPAEYVVFRNRTEATPVVAFARPDYFADIIVLAESGIDSVQDLKGRKVALGDIGSTSKHLAPLQILKDNGIDPQKDVERVHTSVKLGWEALKRGDVAAFATTDDKYQSLRAKEKDLPPGAFKVIARGRDLPNDVLVVRPGVDPAAVEKVRQAITANSDELVAAILKGEDNQKFKGMKFLLSVKDSDYDYVRAMYQTAGYPQFSKFPGE
jgi:phosphonate transport system substrate-binding protein